MRFEISVPQVDVQRFDVPLEAGLPRSIGEDTLRDTNAEMVAHDPVLDARIGASLGRGIAEPRTDQVIEEHDLSLDEPAVVGCAPLANQDEERAWLPGRPDGLDIGAERGMGARHHDPADVDEAGGGNGLHSAAAPVHHIRLGVARLCGGPANKQILARRWLFFDRRRRRFLLDRGRRCFGTRLGGYIGGRFRTAATSYREDQGREPSHDKTQSHEVSIGVALERHDRPAV